MTARHTKQLPVCRVVTSRGGRGWVEWDADDGGDRSEVAVLGEQLVPAAPGHCGDEAIEQPARGDSDLAARSVDARRGIEIRCGIEAGQMEPGEQPPELSLPGRRAGAGEDIQDLEAEEIAFYAEGLLDEGFRLDWRIMAAADAVLGGLA